MLLCAILVMAVSVWLTLSSHDRAHDEATDAIAAAQGMRISMLEQETGLRGFIQTHDPAFLSSYTNGRPQFALELDDAKHNARGPDDRRFLDAQEAVARRWQALAERQLDATRAGKRPQIDDARQRKREMDGFRRLNAAFLKHLDDEVSRERKVARRRAVLVIVALGALFGLLGWWAVERPIRRESTRRRRVAEFTDALQVARSEQEAFDVLRRHIERWRAGARAAVLMRNASANRLHAATGTEDMPLLAEKLDGAEPESCLAVRLAKPYARDDRSSELMRCELCGELAGASTCVPSVVGGEVVGSVLVESPQPFSDDEVEDLQTSVGSAGPVIANLRNLAIAELRAATDALTGLPNARAVHDTLSRMVAQASRGKNQMAAVLFDLDHFKQINDIHGHAKGDEVLALVGRTVGHTVRESDFAGRYGGEEFVAFLPDTSVDGAVVLAEKLREAIEELYIEGLGGPLTASFGVAVLPGDAVTADQLLRAADEALYAAKRAGRNRVEAISRICPGSDPEPEAAPADQA